MNIRDMLLEKCLVPVKVSEEAKRLIDRYKGNILVIDDDYFKYPLYALLRILSYTKKTALAYARKVINAGYTGADVMENQRIYMALLEDYRIAYGDFVNLVHISLEEMVELDEVRRKISEATALLYESNVDLLIDIFDTNSVLYEIEGVDYAR